MEVTMERLSFLTKIERTPLFERHKLRNQFNSSG